AGPGFDNNSAFDGTGNVQDVDITRYFAPRDNGSMNMFRLASQAAGGTINMASGTTLNAGGLTDILALNMNGSTANLSAASTQNGTVISANANGAAGTTNTLNLGANNTLRVNQFIVAA